MITVDRVLGGILSVLTVGAIAGYPERARWVFFACAAGMALIGWARRVWVDREIAVDLIDIALVMLILYGAASITWSNNPNGGIQTVIIACGCFTLYGYLKRYADEMVCAFLAVGVMLAAWVALLSNLWLPPESWCAFGNSGYAAETLIACLPLLWPAVRSVHNGLGVIALATCAAVVAYVFHWTPSLLGAAAVMSVAFGATLVWGFRASVAFGTLAVLSWAEVGVFGGYVFWPFVSEHVMTRAEMWFNALFMIRERPFFGWGLGSFVETYPTFKEAHGAFFPFVNLQFEAFNTGAEALHNEPLQVFAELGVVGFLGLLCLLWAVCRTSLARLSPIATAGLVGLTAILGMSLLEYPFQRGATLYLTILALAFATRHPAPWSWRIAVPVPPAYLGLIAATPVATVLVMMSWSQYRAEDLFDQARASNDPVHALNLEWSAHRADPLHRHIRASLPVFLDILIGRYSIDHVPTRVIEMVYAEVDDSVRFDPGVLVSRANLLLATSRGDTPEFQKVLADLKRGSARVAVVYAIEGRYLILHARYAEALAVLTKGESFTKGRSNQPVEDAAVRTNLEELRRVAESMLKAGCVPSGSCPSNP